MVDFPFYTDWDCVNPFLFLSRFASNVEETTSLTVETVRTAAPTDSPVNIVRYESVEVGLYLLEILQATTFLAEKAAWEEQYSPCSHCDVVHCLSELKAYFQDYWDYPDGWSCLSRCFLLLSTVSTHTVFYICHQ